MQSEEKTSIKRVAIISVSALLATILMFVAAISIITFTKKEDPSVSETSSTVTSDSEGFFDYTKINSFKDIQYTIDATLSPQDFKVSASQTTSFIQETSDTLSNIHFHLYTDSYNSLKTMPSIEQSVNEIKEKYPQISDADLLGGIEISNVTVNNQSVEFTQENQDLNIALNTPSQKGDTQTISMDFTVKIPYGTQRIGFYDEVYSITQWYPILSQYNNISDQWNTQPFNPIGETDFVDCANYNVKITAPKDYVLSSSGVDENSQIDNNMVTLTTSLENARHFVFMASNIFKVKYYDVDGAKMRFVYRNTSPQKEETIDSIARYGVDSLNFYNKNIYRHSAKEFDVIETGVVGFAMEYSGLVQMGNYDNVESGYAAYEGSILAHEFGHQWFYWNVGSDSYSEPCMDEGFTTYITALFFSKTYQSNAFDINSLETNFDPVKTHSACDSISLYSQDKRGELAYFYTAYEGTAQVLVDLQQLIGNDKMFEILNTYSTKYHYQFGGIRRFLDVVKDVTDAETANKVEKALTTKGYKQNELETL